VNEMCFSVEYKFVVTYVFVIESAFILFYLWLIIVTYCMTTFGNILTRSDFVSEFKFIVFYHSW